MPRAALIAFLLVFALPVLAQNGDDDAWDVTAPFGPTEDVSFTTTEGTWMSLDVSPDGSEIVFDLLGDIYVMPIAGGTARPLTNDAAWNVQPRFSPDGNLISFTSDREGGDNIFVMNRDGSGVRAITNEDFRLLNNAFWHPEGEYVVARKHFTGTRSLGAGEMWMYHVSGEGSGIQLTERRNDQQDAGEPAFSPDGQYLYWSEDMTPGPLFQYNKDPHSGIYVIRRLDLETGDITNLTGGPGGAIRPTPSPNGDYLAFVRRVRDKTVLFVRDLASGAEYPIFDGLSKDQQETWATFGVYPNFAWLPGGDALVVWAQGGLWRVGVERNVVLTTAERIPFQAQVERRIHEAVRFDIEVHPERFPARMIRHVHTAPDGRSVVFNALGSLWVSDLRGGAPRQLTPQGKHAFFPEFSPDGRSVVYVGWDDEALATIYTIPVAGGNPRALTTRPGYYRNPRFSPDGSRIVFERIGGDGILGTVHGTEPGLYFISAGGGEMTLITRQGREPRFAPDGDRVFFLTGFGIGKEYKSVRFDGGDERTHFDLQYVNQVVPSPDGRWVAFTDLHNAYIAPFPQTGRPLALARDMRSLPVSRITRDAGWYLHWSADGQRVHWSLGPEYFTKEVREAFAFMRGDGEEVAGPPETGYDLALEVQADIPSGTIAFTGARIITMDGDQVIEDGTLVVEGNRIVAVGAAGQVTVPAAAEVIDASGTTIMPGMIDVHAHIRPSGSGITPRQSWSYHANVAFGVTTAHDPSANTEMIFSEGEMLRAGRIVGPRLFSTGTILYGADGDFRAIINSLDDARSHLRRLQAVGAFSVKSYNQPRRDQRQQVLQAARELGMMVVPEGGSFLQHNLNMIVDGHTGIEHAVPVYPLHDDVVQLWAASDVGYTPTLVVGYGGLWGEEYWYQESDVWEHDRLMSFTPRAIVDPLAIRRGTMPEWDYNHVGLAAAARDLVEAGVRVQLGAHGQMQGLAAHWELWSFVQGGMTPLQAIRAATLDGAYYLGMDGDLGSLEPGKLADLIVLEANPLEDIRNTDHIRFVMLNGRLYDASTMDEIAPTPREREPFWFERPGSSDEAVWRDHVKAVSKHAH